MNIQSAFLGGGCFWCTEALFKRLRGIVKVVPGYAGGDKPNPMYEQVCNGDTGHAEVIKIDFDSEQISLKLCWTYSFQCMTQPLSTAKALTLVPNIDQSYFMQIRNRKKWRGQKFCSLRLSVSTIIQ